MIRTADGGTYIRRENGYGSAAIPRGRPGEEQVKMNIGIRLHDTKPGTLRERLGYAREQGFSCVQLAMSKAVPGFSMAEAPKLLTRELAEEVKEELRRAEMECAVLGCYLGLAVRDEEEAEKVREIYEAHLRFAGWIGAGCVGTETPSPEAGDGAACQTEEFYQLLLKRLKPIARTAEETGSLLAVEPVCSHIVYTPALAERMLNDLDCGQLRIILDAVNLLDSAHVGEADAIIEEGIRRLGRETAVLHMKDYLPAPGKPRPQTLPCGKGQMKYGPLLKLAREKNLPMTLEDTVPENAEETRIWLETAAKTV